MALRKYFISCDWGTSNFRLRVVDYNELLVIVEHHTDQGIRILYEQFLAQQEIGQTDFFKNYLHKQIATLPIEHQQHLVVASGMASSNIGLKELDCAPFPFTITGHKLSWELMPLSKDNQLLLISGAKDHNGMMHGEEIQAIGLATQLADSRNGLLLLPGTHSKHIVYASGVFTELKIFMTGELFELLSQKSILAHSLSSTPWSENAKKAFSEGVLTSKTKQLSQQLFSVRARHLNENHPKEENYYYLHGLLIGEELSYLQKTEDTVFLAASGPFQEMYQTALEQIIPVERQVYFNKEILDKALLEGQRKIVTLHEQQQQQQQQQQ